MKQLLVILLFLHINITVNATTYYVSSTGSDSNSGLTEVLAWQTIGKVNATSFSAGDSILFKRGDTFYGKIVASDVGRSGSPITYGAYGFGDKPIIIGLTTVTGWTDLGFNIWRSNDAVSTLPDLKMVLINGQSTPMGRYPNGDASYPFLPNFYAFQSHTGTGSGASSITSSSLTDGNDWTGANVVIRMNQWTFHNEVITGQSGSTISFDGVAGDLSNDWGFFIQNDIRTLDQQGEWYYDPSTKKISVYSVGAPTDVKVSTVDTLFQLYSNIPATNYTSIDNINFIGGNTHNIWLSGNIVFSVTNCDVSYAGYEGLMLYGGGIKSGTVDNNTFYNNGSGSMFSSGDVENLTITNNNVNMSGVISVYKQNDYTDAGITISGANSLIQYNTVDSSAYSGIEFKSTNSQVRNNFINYSNLVRGDGGGIYTGFADEEGKVIDGNIILNSIGNPRGTAGNDYFAFGIYIDALGNHLSITNNTIANVANAGIYLHDANYITVRNNTVYNAGGSSATWANGGIAVDGAAGEFTNTIHNNVVTNNTVVATSSGQYALNYYAESGSGNQVSNFGVLDSNYYVKVNSSDIISSNQTGINGIYTLSEWQSASGKDANSVGSPKSISSPDSIIFVYNPTDHDSTITLPYNYIDAQSNSYNGTITLSAYSGKVLIQNGTATGGTPPPIVNAGVDQYINLGDTATLSGSVESASGHTSTYLWTFQSGDGTFDDATILNPLVTDLSIGENILRLTATQDDEQSSYSEMKIIVSNPASTDLWPLKNKVIFINVD